SVVDYLIAELLISNYNGDYSLFNPLFLNMSLATILLGLTLVVPFFFATQFGPWVGLVTALPGALIGDYFSKVISVFSFPWYGYAGLAVLGFLSGLAFL